MNRLVQLAAVVAAGLSVAAPAPALAAHASLGVPDSSGQAHASRTDRVEFRLGPEFRFTTRAEGNVPAHTYVRDVHLADGTVCQVVLGATGRIQRKRPTVDGGLFGNLFGTFKVTERGRSGELRWYLGPSGTQRLAAGVATAPKRLRTAKGRYVLYSFQLTNANGGTSQEQACLAELKKSNAALKTAVRTAHIVRKS